MADKNYLSYANEINVVVEDQAIMPPDVSYADTLKFSNCWWASVNNCSIVGGTEDCIDCYRGGEIYIQNSDLIGLKRNGITIKGEVEKYRIEGVSFTNHGSDADIEIGQFGIHEVFPFKRKPCDGVISDVKMIDHSNGQKVKIRVWNADVPEIRASNVKIIKIPWAVWFPYFCFRRIMVKFYKSG